MSGYSAEGGSPGRSALPPRPARLPSFQISPTVALSLNPPSFHWAYSLLWRTGHLVHNFPLACDKVCCTCMQLRVQILPTYPPPRPPRPPPSPPRAVTAARTWAHEAIPPTASRGRGAETGPSAWTPPARAGWTAWAHLTAGQGGPPHPSPRFGPAPPSQRCSNITVPTVMS